MRPAGSIRRSPHLFQLPAESGREALACGRLRRRHSLRAGSGGLEHHVAAALLERPARKSDRIICEMITTVQQRSAFQMLSAGDADAEELLACILASKTVPGSILVQQREITTLFRAKADNSAMKTFQTTAENKAGQSSHT